MSWFCTLEYFLTFTHLFRTLELFLLSPTCYTCSVPFFSFSYPWTFLTFTNFLHSGLDDPFRTFWYLLHIDVLYFRTISYHSCSLFRGYLHTIYYIWTYVVTPKGMSISYSTYSSQGRFAECPASFFIEVTTTVVKSVSDGLRDWESETQLNLTRPLRISPGPRHLTRPLAAVSTYANRPGTATATAKVFR